MYEDIYVSGVYLQGTYLYIHPILRSHTRSTDAVEDGLPDVLRSQRPSIFTTLSQYRKYFLELEPAEERGAAPGLGSRV